jgi:hypothetical protein
VNSVTFSYREPMKEEICRVPGRGNARRGRAVHMMISGDFSQVEARAFGWSVVMGDIEGPRSGGLDV